MSVNNPFGSRPEGGYSERMNHIRDKTVLITGASSGIGEACARRFAAEGASLVLWARRSDRLRQQAAALENACGRPIVTEGVDVRDRAAVFEAADRLKRDGVIPDVLINNAGLASGMATVQEGDPDDWDRMIDTNVKGLLHVSRAVLPMMHEAGRGHVINIGSTAGHLTYPRGNVYAATKFAVRALTDGMNLDQAGSPIRVSSVDPGMVETEFSVVRFHGDEERARQVYAGFTPLSADDVADAVFYVANAPPHVNVFDLVLMPTAQRNVYVVDRKD
jgi:3-hydroxy acid dehydrogenase / malonic semialdehyde reductase